MNEAEELQSPKIGTHEIVWLTLVSELVKRLKETDLTIEVSIKMSPKDGLEKS